MKETLTETLTRFLDNEPDITKLQDPKYKAAFFERIEKETKQKANSIQATYAKLIGKYAESKGQPADNFRKKKPQKYSGALAINTNLEKKNVADAPPPPQALGGKPLVAPPAQAAAQQLEPLPMPAIAGSVHSFLRAIQPDLEELTPSEKEDVGTCLNMVIGDWLSGHDEARKVLGAVGLLGIYGGKIRKAVKKKKERKEKEKKEAARLEAQITPKAESEFKQQAMKTLEQNQQYQFTDDV